MQTPDRKPPAGVVFDTSMESMDRVLGLAMVLAYNSKGEARLTSLSISRNNLKIASFTDMMARFLGTSPSIGMHEKGTAGTTVPPMMSTPLARTNSEGKPVFNRVVEKLIDTADPVALIRNGLTAQQDQNAVVILAGAPVNLLGLLALPASKALIQKKVRGLVIAGPLEDAAGFTKLFAEWPGPIVVAGDEIGQALQFPGGAIETDFAWAANHPVVDAYKAAKTMPYNTPASTMAAVLYAIQPQGNHFKLSEPQGRQRQLIVDDTQKERVIQIYREMASSKPPEPRRGGRGA